MARTLKDFVSEAKSRVREVSVEEAAKRLAGSPKPLILDVREPGEFAQGHIPGALNVPRGLLEPKADTEYAGREPRLQDRKQPVVVHCASGARSALAADVLRQMGFEDVVSMAGGFAAWEKEGHPVER